MFSKPFRMYWTPTLQQKLLNKMRFDVHLYFSHSKVMAICSSNPGHSSSKETKSGLEYTALALREHTETHNGPLERKIESTKGLVPDQIYMISLSDVLSHERKAICVS